MGMVWDPLRKQVVLFGGKYQPDDDITGTYYGDTWIWDGSAWTEQHPTTSPDARDAVAIAYDVQRREVVLFGGYSPALGRLRDTWVWDGANWTKRNPASSPPARWDAGMAYDASHHEIVLFGGTTGCDEEEGCTNFNDTWTWDGANWTKRSPATSPAPRQDLGIASDTSRGQVVLFGGRAGRNLSLQADTWSWDGSNWTLRAPAHHPSPRAAVGMAEDPRRQKIVLFGGRTSSETWTWDGSDWTLAQPATSPPGMEDMGLAYDVRRSRVLLFGGDSNGILDDTWIWDGVKWVEKPRTTPEPRQDAGVAYDPINHQLVVFSGVGPPGSLSDTWTWDGTSWTQQHPPVSPSARTGMAMVFDPAIGRIVLFGGQPNDSPGPFPSYLDDTWTWDGATWTQLDPLTIPGRRTRPAASYDPISGGAVLFGGLDFQNFQYTLLSSMWAFDGTNWTEQHPPALPAGRFDAAMAAQAGGGLVLFGGCCTGQCCAGDRNDTWMWDGNTWQQAELALSPQARQSMGLAFDPGNAVTLLYGGGGGAGVGAGLADTWTWNHSLWTPLHFLSVPGFRQAMGFAYDDDLGQVLMFGGVGSVYRDYLNDLWTWNGSAWHQLR